MAYGWYCYKDMVAFTGMVVVESINVGLNILFKAATRKGMSSYVFIVYSYLLATLLLLPSSLFFHRSATLPPFSFSLFCKICLLGIIGSLTEIFGYAGVDYSSPTLASALSNLTPAFTFILAIIFSMEKLVLRSSSSQAKIVGTIVSISGAFAMTLYEGPPIVLTLSPSKSLHWPHSLLQSNWSIGGLLLAAENLLVPVWFIIQANIMKEYPVDLVVVFLYSLCTTVMCAAVALVAEPNSSAWRLKADISLVAIVYSGLFESFISTVIQTWALRLKGPVYVSLFKPLSIAIAAAMGVMFLGDTLHLGRMEKLALRSSSSQAKIMGTIVSISGAFAMTLYEGPPIILTLLPSKSLHWPRSSLQSDWSIGGLLLAVEYLLVPIWFIVQANIMKEYPVELVVVF
ncbi:WAT1-related protein At5g40240-like isoform X2 [Cornus florida]|uniref:WAT1-related protein At5g40240-like isoform X2 n=1 Tax=Cornus florida TaxID=4283 RepID=UPI0028975187|nr:WAT1-related protein At5g40240-like isoform X2 [Cornus florida]